MKQLSPHARTLLADARAMRPPASSKAAVRRAVAASVAAGVTGAALDAALAGSAGATVAGSTAGGHGLLAVLALWGGAGIVAGIAVTAAGVAVLRPAAPKAVPPASSITAGLIRSTAAVPGPRVVEATEPRQEPSAESAPGAVAPARHPGVAEELRLLAQARTALRDGDPERALVLTGQHDERFGKGALAEEALATRILALCALGRLEEGRAGIARLERTAPNSPQLPRVRSACRDNP